MPQRGGCGPPAGRDEEGRLAEAIRLSGRVFQTASENQTVPEYKQMCEIVRSGQLADGAKEK